MKQGLQKIEATLTQLDQKQALQYSLRPRKTQVANPAISFTIAKTGPKPQPDTSPTETLEPIAETGDGNLAIDLPSFAIAPHPSQRSSAAPAPPAARPISFKVSATPSEKTNPAIAGLLSQLQTKPDTASVPNLPKSKVPPFSSSRQVTNPEFALSLLREIEGLVVGWQKDLQGLLLKIQDLYMEGPVIDGWLESEPADTRPSGPTVLRHAEIDRLMEYVDELCKGGQPETDVPGQPRTHYRLCGLDADGQLWTRPCPAEQVPNISLAIARYQKFRQLQAQKQTLERRLDHFSQTLIALHSHFQQDDS